MNKAILGKKIGMTQIFLSDGRLAPVTVVGRRRMAAGETGMIEPLRSG